MKKIILVALAVAILVGSFAFYGGMMYEKWKPRQMLQFGGSRGGLRNRMPGGRTGMDFTAGEIIARDNTTVTVKLRDGGSKIIFYSGTTEIGKLIGGAPE